MTALIRGRCSWCRPHRARLRDRPPRALELGAVDFVTAAARRSSWDDGARRRAGAQGEDRGARDSARPPARSVADATHASQALIPQHKVITRSARRPAAPKRCACSSPRCRRTRRAWSWCGTCREFHTLVRRAPRPAVPDACTRRRTATASLPGTRSSRPATLHMKVDAAARELRRAGRRAPPVNHHRPSVDVLFHSCAQHLGPPTPSG